MTQHQTVSCWCNQR